MGAIVSLTKAVMIKLSKYDWQTGNEIKRAPRTLKQAWQCLSTDPYPVRHRSGLKRSSQLQCVATILHNSKLHI